jgi:hypothetical protein
MILLTPNLSMAPGARVVVNSLYDSKDAGFLTQDLLLVELSGRTFIDVSWFPEHDPSGIYVITVFRGHDEILEAEAKTAYEAVNIVESLAVAYSSALGNVSYSARRIIQFQPAA